MFGDGRIAGDIAGPFDVDTFGRGNVGIVRSIAAQRGWGSGPQWNALFNLIQGESGFRNTAQNPNSTAYGIFQFLNSTWRTVGGRKTSDPALQTTYGLRYIANAYGTPAAAYSAWLRRSPHWYEQGTPWVPNDQLAFLHRGEAVIPADVNRRRLAGSTGATFQFTNCTFLGGSQAQFEDILVRAYDKAKQKGRIR